MTTIFLNLGLRTTDGELFPNAPFRAFVKFDTSYNERGGLAVLSLEDKGEEVGEATIDWPRAEAHTSDRDGQVYLVANGALEEVDLSDSYLDSKRAGLVFEAIDKAGWLFLGHHELDPERAQERFERWVQANL